MDRYVPFVPGASPLGEPPPRNPERLIVCTERLLVAAVRDYYLDFWATTETRASMRRASAHLPQTWLLGLSALTSDTAKVAQAPADDPAVVATAVLGAQMALPFDVQVDARACGPWRRR